jgi:hypothetical protein
VLCGAVLYQPPMALARDDDKFWLRAIFCSLTTGQASHSRSYVL